MNTPSPSLILASRSARRHEILRQAGYEFEVCPAPENVEDSRRENESPQEFALRQARQKAAWVAGALAHEKRRALVLGCDTIVVCRDEILGKPRDRDDARRMLRLLGGSVHRVLSGLCLYAIPEHRVLAECDETVLTMRPLGEEELREYLDSGLWSGKAGAFGLQDRNAWIRIRRGSASNVVGLPMELFATMYEDVVSRNVS